MNITDRIEKYLRVDEKVSKKDAMGKVMKTIKSVKNDKQLDVATNMARNFIKMYGDTWKVDLVRELTGLPPESGYITKFLNAIKNKKAQMDHEAKQIG